MGGHKICWNGRSCGTVDGKKSCSSWYAKDPSITGFHTSQDGAGFQPSTAWKQKKKLFIQYHTKIWCENIAKILLIFTSTRSWKGWDSSLLVTTVKSSSFQSLVGTSVTCTHPFWSITSDSILSVDFVSLTWKSHSLCLSLPLLWWDNSQAERFG